MKPFLLSFSRISVCILVVLAMISCAPGGGSGQKSASGGAPGAGKSAGKNAGNSASNQPSNSTNPGPNGAGNGPGTGLPNPLSTPPPSAQQTGTTIAAMGLGVPPDQVPPLDLNTPPTLPPPLPPLPPPGSVPEPTTAILVLSGAIFWIVSHLRKRQEVFDYYNK